MVFKGLFVKTQYSRLLSTGYCDKIEVKHSKKKWRSRLRKIEIGWYYMKC